MMTTAKLLLHCPDKPGIGGSDRLYHGKQREYYLSGSVRRPCGEHLFMRIEWELKDFLVPKEKIEDYFETLYGQKYDMIFRLYFSDVKPRMAIFVSKMSHCLLICWHGIRRASGMWRFL